ncbi:hypothetical protein WN51_11174 [Melipona quadrifasciata]|uniref:Uncharacterized protein n=1 Tax=Melipona quadrifasciata TaxID=166423 RepID=A0A0M9A458_9HYME|nr:hypothetical protein WN51_11174 [Melipona quadrifasciata]
MWVADYRKEYTRDLETCDLRDHGLLVEFSPRDVARMYVSVTFGFGKSTEQLCNLFVNFVAIHWQRYGAFKRVLGTLSLDITDELV